MRNKKVGIVTCYNNHNYGSMLQAYATLITLGKMGYQCEFVNYKKKTTIIEMIRFIPRFFNMYLMCEKKRLIEKKIKLIKYPDIQNKNIIRSKAYARFPKEYYGDKISKPLVGFKGLKIGARNYDIVLVGSDQLWLPAGLPTNFYNLMFVPEDIAKVAYSTSFGVSEIPFYQRKRTIRYLNRLDKIAVREQSGQKIIKELTDRDVPVVLDPTLLLTADEWIDKIPDQKIIDNDYIFCYFLGSNPEHRKAVLEFASKVKLKVYDMPHIDEFVPGDLNFANEHLYDIDSAQFINLIRHATFVCTDSFHASVFSILYHKNFVIFERYSDPLMASRNSRITTLCNITGLESRIYKGTPLFEYINNSINYDEVDKKLKVVRSESVEYLNKAMEK